MLLMIQEKSVFFFLLGSIFDIWLLLCSKGVDLDNKVITLPSGISIDPCMIYGRKAADAIFHVTAKLKPLQLTEMEMFTSTAVALCSSGKTILCPITAWSLSSIDKSLALYPSSPFMEKK